MRHPLVISLVESQIAAASQVLAVALQTDPLFAYVLPDHNQRVDTLAAFFARNLTYGHLFGQVFVTPGDIGGVAVWLPPGSDVTSERAAAAGYNQIAAILGQDGVQRLGQTLDYVELVHHHDLAPDHYYLSVLGVSPERQGQGVGRALVQAGVAQAEANGLPCYVDTTVAANVPFYETVGFRVRLHSVEPQSGVPFWTLGNRLKISSPRFDRFSETCQI